MAAGTEILTIATGIVSNLDGIPDGLDEAEADEILQAFHNVRIACSWVLYSSPYADCLQCIHVNQETLKVVVAKVDLIKTVPVFGGPAASLLGSFEGFANVSASDPHRGSPLHPEGTMTLRGH